MHRKSLSIPVFLATLVVGCSDPAPTNQAPELETPPDQTSAEGGEIALQLVATDPDGDPLTWSATGLPTDLSLDQQGLITGVLPFTASAGSPYEVTIVVSDGALSDTATFTWTVTPTNRPPTLTSPGDQHHAEDDDVLLQLQASDPDGDPLHFTVTGLPPGLSLDAESGIIDGILAFGASVDSPYQVELTVSDGELSDSVAFSWTVDFTNRPPMLEPIPDQEHLAHTSVSLMLEADDPDGDPLHFEADGLPPGLTLDPESGWISGELLVPGFYEVLVSVTDGALTDTTLFTWLVRERPPGLAWTKQGLDLRGSYWVPEPSLTQDLKDFAVTQASATPGDDVWHVLVGDVTGDGAYHVIWTTAGNRVRWAPAADLTAHTDALGANFRAWLLHDADGDGVLDIGIEQTATNPDVRFYRPDGEQIWRYHAAHSGDGSYYPVAAHDGKLWMALAAGFSRSPRGVRQIDLETATVDWTFNVATLLWGRGPTISIDETRERITLNSGTPHNGATQTVTLADGSQTTLRDNHLYHMVLDFDGTGQFARPVDNTRKTGSLGQAMLFDGRSLGAEGKDPVHYRGDAQAHLLDADGSVITSVVIGHNERSSFVFNETEVFFYQPNSGTLRRHALDDELTHDWTTEVPTGGNLIGLADLTGDGDEELVFVGGSEVFLLAAATGDILRRIEVGPGVRSGALADLTRDGRYEILIGGRDGVYILSAR